MFNYSTSTILNTDKDLGSDVVMFSSIEGDDKHGNILRVKREYTFEMPGITKVYKKVAAEPVPAEITVNCSNLIAALPEDLIYPVAGRLNLYIALEGSEESGFANDFYQKGLPFSIGYVVNSADMSGADLAAMIKKNVDKFNVNTVVRRLFDVTIEDDTLTFKCTDEYMRFKSIIALLDLGFRELEVVHLFDGELDNDQDVITIVDRGTNGFGTFRHLVKDLRLPTATATSWTAPYKTDRPIPGALYDQYTIYYSAPSLTNPSLVAVGDKTLTHTTHVFWLNQTISDSFTEVVAAVVGAEPVKDDPTAIFEEV